MNRLAIIAVTGALAFMLTACGEDTKTNETIKIQKESTGPKDGTMKTTEPVKVEPVKTVEPSGSEAAPSTPPAPPAP